MPGLRLLTFSAGLFVPPASAAALVWSDRLYGWPEHPSVTISLLWASLVIAGLLLARSLPRKAPFLAFILPVTMVLGAAAAATGEGLWLWLDSGAAEFPILGGDNATMEHVAQVVGGSAIGIGVPLGFVAAHVVALEESLARKLWSRPHARLS